MAKAAASRTGGVKRRSIRHSSPIAVSTKRERQSETLTPLPYEDQPETPRRKVRKVKHEAPPSSSLSPELKPVIVGNATPNTLKERKLKQLSKNASDSPFPTFARPTASECSLAHSILSSLHGARVRPAEVVASTTRAGCGDSPSVLDALVRTILSQNTSDKNSTRAKLSMDAVYGGSDRWEAIVQGGQEKLQEAIKCGGLSQVKSKVILKILGQAKEKYGDYTLDHLHKASTEDAMAELLAFDGIGPKTASCVLLFCLQREDFAVDTHVHRITGLLGWRPKSANREQTYHHLNKRIPDEHKYGLHILFVHHGKVCEECKAGGKRTGKCELRKAFREGAVKGEVEEGVKDEVEEDLEEVKQEGGGGGGKGENVKEEVRE